MSSSAIRNFQVDDRGPAMIQLDPKPNQIARETYEKLHEAANQPDHARSGQPLVVSGTPNPDQARRTDEITNMIHCFTGANAERLKDVAGLTDRGAKGEVSIEDIDTALKGKGFFSANEMRALRYMREHFDEIEDDDPSWLPSFIDEEDKSPEDLLLYALQHNVSIDDISATPPDEPTYIYSPLHKKGDGPVQSSSQFFDSVFKHSVDHKTKICGLDPDAVSVSPAGKSVETANLDQTTIMARSTDVKARRTAAKNEFASPDVLDSLVHDVDDVVRYYVARNRATRSSTLRELSKTGSETIKTAVAENRSAPGDVLNELANDMSLWVRRAVADNLATPSKTLSLLSYDADPWVRLAVINNLKLPAEDVARMANDRNALVRFSAIRRMENTPQGDFRFGLGSLFSAGSFYTPRRNSFHLPASVD